MNHYQMTERASAQVEIDFLRTELNKAKAKLQDTEHAKQLLASRGYSADNLWHVEDVTQNYDCSNDVAYDILTRALRDEYVIEQIFEAIDKVATALEVKIILNQHE